MNESYINEQHQLIIRLLDSKQLKEALLTLNTFIQNVADWDLQTALENIQTSYHYLLQYMQQGIVDPQRMKMYNQLMARAYQLADQTRVARLTPISFEYYFDRKRYCNLVPTRPFAALQLELESFTEEVAINNLLHDNQNKENAFAFIRSRHETAYVELFYLVWLSGKWAEEEHVQALSFLQSPLVQINDLALFVGAVTLSLMEQFDIRKFMLLFDAYEHSSNEVNQRAIVGLALLCYQYDKRLRLYPQVLARLEVLNENVIFSNNLSRIQIQLLRCRETEKINKKMRDEIIPEMMKNPILTHPKIEPEREEDTEGDDKNPDWMDWMEQSGLEDKLKEMSELQMEGADVYMSTFSQLKTYPFFREMANWFYPFDVQHSAVVQSFATTFKKQNILLDSILQSGFFCNSDKYSFCFTLMQVPEAQREMMSGQFEAQNEAMNEAKRFDKIIAYSQQAETVSNQYIHDLYRFFKIHPRNHEFSDPFKMPLNLQNCRILSSTLSDISDIQTLAEYFFHKNYLAEASSLYSQIATRMEGNAELFQKIGYCLQKGKSYEQAIEAYLKSDMIKSDSVWTNRHLAVCYRMLKQYPQALDYYYKVEAVNPDKLNILTQIGQCLAALGRYEEALKYFFKIEYLDHGSFKAIRAIAWCSFVSGKHEQAMTYYDRLPENDLLPQDCINAAHVAWSMDVVEKAVRLYKLSLSKGETWEAFLHQFESDKAALISQGIKEEEMPLMLDLVRV